jgi:hypothetical protein
MISIEAALKELVDAISEDTNVRDELEAGCDGDGPYARALRALGRTEEANALLLCDNPDCCLEEDQ